MTQGDKTMKFVTILAAALLAAGVATANGNHENNGHDHGDSDSSAVVGDVSSSSSAAAAASAVSGDSSAVGSAVSGSSSVTVETEDSASSPGTLILGTCQAGVTAQTQMGGGSMGGPDEVCLLFTLAQMQAHYGDVEGSRETLERAENILKWRGNVVRRFFQAIPLVGRIF